MRVDIVYKSAIVEAMVIRFSADNDTEATMLSMVASRFGLQPGSLNEVTGYLDWYLEEKCASPPPIQDHR